MTDARVRSNERIGIPPLCGKCGGRTDGKVSAPSMRGFGALISCECPTEAPTNVLPIRPSVTGESEETEFQKWLRVAQAKVRVKMALGATPEMAQLHIKAALDHLRGLGAE